MKKKNLTELGPTMERLKEYQKDLQVINTSNFEQIRLMPDRKILVATIYRLIDKCWYKIRPYIKDELKKELADDIGLYYSDLKLIMNDIEGALGHEDND